jgi:hypothetical protein
MLKDFLYMTLHAYAAKHKIIALRTFLKRYYKQYQSPLKIKEYSYTIQGKYTDKTFTSPASSSALAPQKLNLSHSKLDIHIWYIIIIENLET